MEIDREGATFNHSNWQDTNVLSFSKKIQSNIDDVIILLNTQKTAERLFTLHSHFITHNKIHYTGGPPLTGKTPTRFPLPRFLAYVRVSGGTSVSRGPQYSPTNTSFM